MSADELIGRIEDEISGGEAETADAEQTHLMFDGGGEVSIIEKPVGDGTSSYRDMPEFRPTEFDQILAQHAAMQQNEETGDPNDDLQAHAQLAEAEERAERANAPFICINPPSLRRGTLGQAVTLKPGTFSFAGGTLTTQDGEAQLLAFWSGEDREVCPVTFTCQPALPLGKFTRVTATLKWGAHGANFRADIDVGTGFEVMVNASSAFLEAYLEGKAYTSAVVTDTASEQIVAGSVGPYAAMRVQPAVRSFEATIVASGSTTFLRPAFAATVVSVDRNSAAAFTMDFLDSNGGLLSTRSYPLGTEFITDPVALQGPVASVRIKNNAAADTIFTVVFGVL